MAFLDGLLEHPDCEAHGEHLRTRQDVAQLVVYMGNSPEPARVHILSRAFGWASERLAHVMVLAEQESLVAYCKSCNALMLTRTGRDGVAEATEFITDNPRPCDTCGWPLPATVLRCLACAEQEGPVAPLLPPRRKDIR